MKSKIWVRIAAIALAALFILGSALVIFYAIL